jgi:hypothetical protein
VKIRDIAIIAVKSRNDGLDMRAGELCNQNLVFMARPQRNRLHGRSRKRKIKIKADLREINCESCPAPVFGIGSAEFPGPVAADLRVIF